MLKNFLKITLVALCFVVFWIFTLLQPSPLTKFLTLGAALFCIGLYGVLTSRSVIKTLIAMEILFNAANINLIAFARFTDLTFVRGQVFALFVMAVAAAEAALGLALIIAVYRVKQTSSLAKLNELNG
jgi:NADH:ubiquinone oxidoreductase subunit K